LGVGAVVAAAEDLVAGREALDGGADLDHDAGECGAGDAVARPEEAGDQPAGEARDAGEVGGAQAAVALRDGAGVDLDEHVVGADGGGGDLGDLEDVGRTVAGGGGSVHGKLLVVVKATGTTPVDEGKSIHAVAY